MQCRECQERGTHLVPTRVVCRRHAMSAFAAQDPEGDPAWAPVALVGTPSRQVIGRPALTTAPTRGESGR
jgi:hypothetical protein